MDKSIKELASEIGDIAGAKPINWPKPITTGVAKLNIRRPNLLAEIEVPIHYAGVHWLVLSVYGKIVEYPEGRRVEDMLVESDGNDCKFLPESLLTQIANEILQGDFA